MRWEKYGWQLSRITNMFTNSSPTPRPRVFKKFNYRIIWADGSKGPAKLSVENMAMGQMLATTHGQSYRAQSLWCEGVGGLWNCPLMTPYTARGFCHAVVLSAFARCNYSVL